VEIQGFGKSPEVVAGQDHYVPRRRQLSPGRQAVGILEKTMPHSERAGLPIHLFHETLYIASDVFGDGHGGIVGRNHGHAPEQLLEGDFAPGLDEHLRSARPPGLPADLHRIRGTDLAVADRLVGEVEGKDLGDGCGWKRVVGIMGEQDPAGRHVHQDS